MADKPQRYRVLRGLAPPGWTCARITGYLRIDPYQTRVSRHMIPIKHPRSGKTLPLKEFVEDMVTCTHMCIQATDGLIFIGRVENSALGAVFIPMGRAPLNALEKEKPEDHMVSL